VAKRLADKQTIEAWQAIKTLYVELPPECQKQCQPHFEEAIQKLANINKIKGYKFSDREVKIIQAKHAYLQETNFELFNNFKNSLFDKGYLETAPTKPRNPQPKTLGEQQ
jgi:hypothetical protein